MPLVPYQGMPQGWMRQIIAASTFRAAYRPAAGCIASFWDNDKKCLVRLDLGYVALRVPFVFRAAASCSSERTFEGVEAAAQNITDLQNERSVEKVRVPCNTRTNVPMGTKPC